MYLENEEHENVRRLFRSILTLENMEECNNFFVDLCTVNEIKAMAQRLEVARMLTLGNTYTQIEQKTGASTATISRVKRFLKYGCNGYRVAFDRLQNEDQSGTEL